MAEQKKGMDGVTKEKQFGGTHRKLSVKEIRDLLDRYVLEKNMETYLCAKTVYLFYSRVFIPDSTS